MDMFSKSTKRKSFSLTNSQIIEDLSALNNNPEHRNKLYVCIDDKVPLNHKFNKMENYVEHSQKLEELTETLKTRVDSLHSLSDDILTGINEIQNKMIHP